MFIERRRMFKSKPKLNSIIKRCKILKLREKNTNLK